MLVAAFAHAGHARAGALDQDHVAAGLHARPSPGRRRAGEVARPRTPLHRVGRAVQRDGGNAQRRGQMRRHGIRPDEEPRAGDGARSLGEAQPSREVDRAGRHLRGKRAGEFDLARLGASGQHRRHPLLGEPLRKAHPALGVPHLVIEFRMHVQRGVGAAGDRRPRGATPRARRRRRSSAARCRGDARCRRRRPAPGSSRPYACRDRRIRPTATGAIASSCRAVPA